jgi:hypothetical protein
MNSLFKTHEANELIMVSGILNYELWITNDNFTKNNKICLTTCVKPETLKRMTYEGVLKKMQTEFGNQFNII